ncbi:MAG: YidC/Oxa1 family membrane protein insertase [Clostridia bacterium]|nr:YidC/Oxa1 family membrane protein insertase [Clostridia bacterium]
MQGIFDIIRIPFGFIIKSIYGWTGSYLVAILLFSVLLKLIMFPFGIKQQKNSQKQAKLRPKENVIRKKYAGRTDRATQMKMQTELQDLYQKENFSPLGGCLPMMVQMLVLLAVYAVVRTPLTYTANLPGANGFNTVEAVKQSVTYLVYEDDMALENNEERRMQNFLTMNKNAVKSYDEKDFWELYNKGNFSLYAEINSIEYIRENEERFIEYFDSATHYDQNGEKVTVAKDLKKEGVTGKAIVEALPELEVGEGSGFDLGLIPSFNLLKEEKLGTKLLLIIPVLNLISAYFGQALTRKFSYQPEQTPEMQSQMRMMNIFMPLFSLYIAFQVPTAVGIYWMMSSILSPVQQIALSKMFPIREISEEEMKEAERLYGGKQKKKKPSSSGEPGKKKRSLVYDDDDEYESVTTAEEKKVLKEKKPQGKTLLDKAPLKDEE